MSEPINKNRCCKYCKGDLILETGKCVNKCKMSENKSNEELYREEFEKLHCSQSSNTISFNLVLERYPDSDYKDMVVQAMWMGYLAGRKAGEGEINKLKAELKYKEHLATELGRLDLKIEEEYERQIKELKAENELCKRQLDKHACTTEHYEKLKEENQKLKNFLSMALQTCSGQYGHYWYKQAEEALNE